MSVLTNSADFATGYVPQMVLGSFLFSLNTAAYQQLERSSEYSWGAVRRFGQNDALQFTGPGDDTINLAGVIYTQYRGGSNQLNQLRALAAQGLPQNLVDGIGNVYGRWVITGVTETQTFFAAGGQPKKQEFTISLKWYDGGPSSLLVSLLASNGGGGLISASQEAQNSIKRLTGLGNLL